MCESGGNRLTVFSRIVGCLELGRWDIPDRSEQSSIVIPIHPFERRVLDLVDISPGPSWPDAFRFEQADDALSHRVVIRVAGAADERFNASLTQTLGVSD